MMKSFVVVIALLSAVESAVGVDVSETAVDPVYELRIVTAKSGMSGRLREWFGRHQADVVPHGGSALAYLVPRGANPNGKVVCLYRFQTEAAARAFDEAVTTDPRFAPLDASHDGPDRLVETVEVIQCRLTRYSPAFEPRQSSEPRVFELRTYTCPSPEKLAFLHDRFANHTLKLFEKHGMENVAYFQPLDRERGGRQLIYLLSHASEAAAKESFAGFRKDPEWIAAKEASETKAGGSLTEKEGGVLSEFFVATEYSPLR